MTHPTPALAGRPPFATDDGEEIYSTPPPTRRVRQDQEPNPNSRTSAYNMYDQYLDESKRSSGVGALGIGFMNGDMDSDDDDDDPPPQARVQNKPGALAATTHSQQQQQQQQLQERKTSPQLQTAPAPAASTTIPLASPRPGYVANPIAALDLSRSPPAVSPPNVQHRLPQSQPQPQSHPSQQQQRPRQGQPQQPPQMQRQMQMHMPQAQRQVQIPTMPRSQPQQPQHPHPLQNPQQQQRPQQQMMTQLPQPLRTGPPMAMMPLSPLGPPNSNPHRVYTSSPVPSVPSTPHPLEAPITPITPAFLRPSKKSPSCNPGSGGSEGDNVKFASTPVIMRSNSEDYLLPKRGDKGDDFWRRFSMVAKEESMMKGKESTWLKKTQNGTNRLSRWVWLVGVILGICIAGGIGVGWYFGHVAPPNQQPVAIGGSADEGGITSISLSSSASLPTNSHAGSSSPHVTPTNTVARRLASPGPTPAPVVVGYRRRHVKRISLEY